MPRIAPAAMVTRSALFTYLTPRLASDAAINYDGLVRGVTSRNYRNTKKAIVTAVTTATKGKLAMDADIQDLANLLDALTPGVEQADQQMMQTAPAGGPPLAGKQEVEGGHDDEKSDIVAKIKAYLEEQGVPPEILQNLDAFLAVPENPKPDVGDPAEAAPSPEPPAAPAEHAAPPAPKKEGEDNDLTGMGGIDNDPNCDEEPLAGPTAISGLDNELEDKVPDIDEVNQDEDEDEEERKRREAMDGVVPEEQEGQVVTKTAMDAAIKRAQNEAIYNQRNIRAAERYVRPWVGDMAMDAAQPADVYRATLKALGMDAKKVDKMHRDALVPVLEAQPKPVRRMMAQPQRNGIAADSKVEGSFLDRFPMAKDITVQ